MNEFKPHAVVTVMEHKWKDETPYSQGEEKIPRVWKAKCGRLNIYVLLSAGSWVVKCRELDIGYQLVRDSGSIGPANVRDAIIAGMLTISSILSRDMDSIWRSKGNDG